MNKKTIFLRHFKTKIDKDKPVAEWDLDENGIKEMNKLLTEYDFSQIDLILTSTEHKAKLTASKIAEKYSTKLLEMPELVEVDRSKAGFIEGDYADVVSKYLVKSNEFTYKWESLENVENRIISFVEFLKKINGNVLVVSHGMYLSILLSKYFEADIVEYWKKLRFGEVIETNFDNLVEVWNNDKKC